MKSRHDMGNVPSWDEGVLEAMIRGEGFWRSSLNAEQDLPPGHEDEEDQHLPWPQPDATWSDRAAFLELLDCAEAGAQRSHEMGYSSCRLCGRQNGCETFVLEHWSWPQGFRHYLVDHHVRPSPEFELFISKWMQRNAQWNKWLDAQFETFPPYFEGSHWVVPFPPKTVRGQPDFYSNHNSDAVDGRGIPCSVGFIRHLESGQFYLMTSKDKNGQQLSGANNYHLTVPANAPVTEYWSVTACDRATHKPIRAWTHRSSNDRTFLLRKNADGSVYIFFGPKALPGKGGNWVVTDPARPFELMFCLYAPAKPLFDKTWVLPDAEKVP